MRPFSERIAPWLASEAGGVFIVTALVAGLVLLALGKILRHSDATSFVARAAEACALTSFAIAGVLLVFIEAISD